MRRAFDQIPTPDESGGLTEREQAQLEGLIDDVARAIRERHETGGSLEIPLGGVTKRVLEKLTEGLRSRGWDVAIKPELVQRGGASLVLRKAANAEAYYNK